MERDVAGVRELAERARGRMTALAGRLAAVAVEPGRVFSGSDPTGTIHVEIDGSGDVTSVRLEAAWREQVGPRGVGVAVVAARRAASTQSVQHQANALRDAATGSSGIPAPSPGPVRAAAGRERPSPEEILEILRDYYEEAPAMRAASDAARTARREVADVQGWATATVKGADVESIDFDPARLRHAPDSEIEHVAVRLFAAAGASARAAQEQLDREFPASARLAAAGG